MTNASGDHMDGKDLSFSTVLDLLKKSRGSLRATRKGWNGNGMWVSIQYPDENSKMGLPYLYMRIVTGELVPWIPFHTDLICEDWGLVLPT